MRTGLKLRFLVLTALTVAAGLMVSRRSIAGDSLRDLQTRAIEHNQSPAAHWGPDPKNYTGWGSHSNRLIPVYTFGTRGAGPGVDLDGYIGPHSLYRRRKAIERLFGHLPTHTLNPNADYCDQTDLFAIQHAALAGGKKKHIFLVIFDGMDWQTTRAAAIYNLRKVAYRSGRGRGLRFLEETADGSSQFGFMVTTPHNHGTRSNVSTQTVTNPGGTLSGGYNVFKGGANPWTPGNDVLYLIGKSTQGHGEHAYPDSAATMTAMTTGHKTYNGSIGVDPRGHRLTSIALLAQRQGWAVGTVTSVPFDHATPAACYANNVSRNDYQDLARDMLGLPSVSHPKKPLLGLDVVLGTGYGMSKQSDSGQGTNYAPGNRYLADSDLKSIDVRNGGRYTVAVRTSDRYGSKVLMDAARQAASRGTGLFGLFGTRAGHLPFQTANGDFEPAPGRGHRAETYSKADLRENPTLDQMTSAAITVLSRNAKGFWLMVEAGDVDWANHDDNLDNSIGAVNSGDRAFQTIVDWVETNSDWAESLVIVTADHGHYLFLDRPELLIRPAR